MHRLGTQQRNNAKKIPDSGKQWHNYAIAFHYQNFKGQVKEAGWTDYLEVVKDDVDLEERVGPGLGLGWFLGSVAYCYRGVQYASDEYGRILNKSGMISSMSRPANPYDNASCESFMKTLKREEVRQRVPGSR